MLSGARPLLIPLTLHTLFAIALWTTGSMHGTWTFECAVGSTAWDLAHGGNPYFGWSDYYDSWTSGYLLWALLEAPLTWLPWDPIYPVKAVSLATTWAVGLLGFLFLREVCERRTALLGATALILCPPALWYYAQLGGNYHYTELVPCLALLWRLAVWTKTERWGARGALELGGLAGLAITTSLGSLLPVALAVVAFVLLRPERLLRGVTWLAAPAGALGAAPLLYKALLHRPFGLPKPEQEFELPYFGGQSRQIGWALTTTGPHVPPDSLPGRLKTACSSLHSTRSQVACREGLGYWFADHLGAWPERLELVVGDQPPQVQRLTLAGVGARLGWAYREESDLARACARYDSLVEGGADACIEGARSVSP